MAKKEEGETTTKAPDELSIEDFENLAAEKTGSAVSMLELLGMLDGKAMKTGAVCKELQVSHSTAYARLKRLKDKSLVQCRYDEKAAYWALTPEGVTAVQTGEMPADVEEES